MICLVIYFGIKYWVSVKFSRAAVFKNKKILLVIPVLLLFSGLAFFKFKSNKNSENRSENSTTVDINLTDNNKENSDSFTPTPFAELTIPYLRQREYESEITSLEEVSQNSSYITYLTSYDSDQLRINALLTRPTGSEPEEGWPAIVFIHGYIPPDQYQTREKYGDYVDYLARNNFVVFKIDLRGHGSSEGNRNSVYYSSDYVVDTLNAYAALQSLDFVNSDQIGLWGHSMAGNIILRSLAVKKDIPAAVVWAGTVFTYQDFVDYGISDSSYQPPDESSPNRQQRQDLFDTYGRFNSDSDFWNEVSPINYLADINASIQLHHAVNDPVATVEYSRNVKRYLDQNGVLTELYEYAQGGHNISNSSFSLAMQRTVYFFKQELN